MQLKGSLFVVFFLATASRLAIGQNLPDEYLSTGARGAEALVQEEAGVDPAPTGLPQIRQDFEGGGFIRLYGHVNMGLLYVDDGIDSEAYVPLDNANSVSRLGLHLERPLAEDWLLSSRFEVGYAPYGSFGVNKIDNKPDWEFNENNIRHIDFNVASDRYGTVSAGQGPMAFAGVMFVDFSDTGVIAASAPEDTAGAQFIRLSDPTQPVDAGPTIGAAFANFDGNRRVRVRYDTPSFYGFHASAAYGRNLLTTNSDEHNEDLFDISVTYGDQFGDLQLGAAAGYYWNSFNREAFGGSAAVLHTPTGLSLSLAAGGLTRDSGPDAAYGYAKLGLTRDLFDFGSSAVSLDYYMGDDIAGAGSESTSVGFAAVQFVDAINSEFWFTWRLYDYDENSRDFEDLNAVFGGVRFRF
jgi:hypothetical protein